MRSRARAALARHSGHDFDLRWHPCREGSFVCSQAVFCAQGQALLQDFVEMVMPIMQLPKATTDELATFPEAAMGLQAVQIRDMAAVVVGGQIAILPDDGVSEQLRALSERTWTRDG